MAQFSDNSYFTYKVYTVAPPNTILWDYIKYIVVVLSEFYEATKQTTNL